MASHRGALTACNISAVRNGGEHEVVRAVVPVFKSQVMAHLMAQHETSGIRGAFNRHHATGHAFSVLVAGTVHRRIADSGGCVGQHEKDIQCIVIHCPLVSQIHGLAVATDVVSPIGFIRGDEPTKNPSDSEIYHSLTKMVALAEEVGGKEHGFRFVQLPFNLAMPEALTVANQNVNDNDVSTIEAAAMLGVTVMTSASIFQGRLTRGLPEHLRELLGPLRTDAHNAIQFVRSTPGVTTALVGMSQTSHAEENLELANVEPLTGEQFMQLISVE